MRADRFQVDQPNGVLDRIAEQVELALAPEFHDSQGRQVALLALSALGAGGDISHSLVDVEFNRHPLSAISLSFHNKPAEQFACLLQVQLVCFF